MRNDREAVRPASPIRTLKSLMQDRGRVRMQVDAFCFDDITGIALRTEMRPRHLSRGALGSLCFVGNEFFDGGFEEGLQIGEGDGGVARKNGFDTAFDFGVEFVPLGF